MALRKTVIAVALAAVGLGAEEEAEHMACSSGIVAEVLNYAPACINPCAPVCKPLGDAISAFKSDGAIGAKRVMCAHQEEFSCAYRHWDACKDLADLVDTVQGLEFPKSEEELAHTCKEVEELVDSGCSSGHLADVWAYSPTCMTPCAQVCKPLGDAISAYASDGPIGAKRVVCSHQQEFSCAYAQWDACEGLVEQAAPVVGFRSVPKSEEELALACENVEESAEVEEKREDVQYHPTLRGNTVSAPETVLP